MMKLATLKDFKIGRDSVAANEQAKIADARARELGEKSAKLKNDWNSLCERYGQIGEAIERACSVRSELESIVDGRFDENLRGSFDWDDAAKSKHIAVEVGKAVIAVPVVGKMIDKMRSELLAHANEMRFFAKQNALPPESTKDLVESDAVR
jgi:hypothetical protein